ncbi:MAG: hypothetical protein DLM72_15440 [Candidatus Nitrosopolaris wilkensis]|nr:MAG: hypothetical protein DLM72_15440 [Candidatus Nitrosopolaris wilkensis]
MVSAAEDDNTQGMTFSLEIADQKYHTLMRIQNSQAILVNSGNFNNIQNYFLTCLCIPILNGWAMSPYLLRLKRAVYVSLIGILMLPNYAIA